MYVQATRDTHGSAVQSLEERLDDSKGQWRKAVERGDALVEQLMRTKEQLMATEQRSERERVDAAATLQVSGDAL
jgi:flagellar biosynthesis chaperone FliJ